MAEVVVVGSGLIGSMLMRPLVAHMLSTGNEYDIRLIDHDSVEARNSPSDLPIRTETGIKKVKAMSNLYKAYGFNPAAVAQKLTEKNAEQLLKNAIIVIGALDNAKARVSVWNAAINLGIPYMDLGVYNGGGLVTWTFGDVDTMQFSPKDDPAPQEVVEEKQPPCELIGTRILSALTTECGVKSMMAFLVGHDPSYIIDRLIGSGCKKGDMIGWVISITGNGYQATAMYLGNTDGGDDVEESG